MKKPTYKDTLIKYMGEISKKENALFIGQQTLWRGNPMSTTLELVDKNKIVEVPLMEESQMGMSLGMAMTEKLVVTFYPRWDFLLLATNQLINNVDKFELMTGKKIHIIVRVGVGAIEPLDPGHQHKGNYIEQFKILSKNITYFDCKTSTDLVNAYETALNNYGVYVISEYHEQYSKEI
jgi:pyruvate/2-oxoglutarate/acetoin dehydrogenase E1 component